MRQACPGPAGRRSWPRVDAGYRARDVYATDEATLVGGDARYVSRPPHALPGRTAVDASPTSPRLGRPIKYIILFCFMSCFAWGYDDVCLI